MSKYEITIKKYDELLNSADIVEVISRYINVIKAGKNFKAICPFHNDTNPSMMISPSKQLYKCFVCGAGGNAINFVEKYEKLSYRQAAKKVAELVGFDSSAFADTQYISHVNQEFTPIYNCLNDISAFYQYTLLMVEGQEARIYLENRNITGDDLKQFKIGLAPEDGSKTIEFLQKKGHSLKTIEETGIISDLVTNQSDRNYGRIVFTLLDKDGKPIGFSGRRYKNNDKSPKYVNSPETRVFHKSEVLYNYSNAKIHARNVKFIYVLEGFMDVIALVKAGYQSTVAIMGTAFTVEHIKLLKELNVELRISLDGDFAGQSAMLKMIPMLDRANIAYRFVANFNDDRDPDDIYKAEGKQGLDKYLSQLIDKTEFTMNYYQKNSNLNSLEERKKFINDIMPFIVDLKSKLEIDDYINKLAEITKFSTSILMEMYNQRLKQLKQKESTSAVINNIDIQHTYKKQISALKYAERTVLVQMLNDQKAIDFYKNEIRLFVDEVYRYVANYLTLKKSEDSKNVYHNIINAINEDFKDDKEKLETFSEEVTQLIAVEDVTYNQGLLEDAKRHIVKLRKKESRLRKLEAQISNATTNTELAQIYEKNRGDKKS